MIFCFDLPRSSVNQEFRGKLTERVQHFASSTALETHSEPICFSFMWVLLWTFAKQMGEEHVAATAKVQTMDSTFVTSRMDGT